MSAKLALDESQYIKLKSLNRDMIAKADKINTLSKNDAGMRTGKLNELQNNCDNQPRSFLNNKQIDAYASYHMNSNFTALEGDKKYFF